MHLRYGLNPDQPAHASPIGERPPIRIVHGEPSYVNILDALNGWQLVRTASLLLGEPVATSFKHVSPAGAAVAGPIDAAMSALYRVPADASALTTAYVRARDADPKSSYGDMIAVSSPVDASLAELLTRVVSDGIIAPGFAPGTVATLRAKKRGRFLLIEADAGFEPPQTEIRDVYGLRLTQRVAPEIPADLIPPGIPASARRDLLLGLVTLRFTQSNSVAYVRDGITLGIGAGQQSRIDCTRLAGAKAETWWQRRSITDVTGDRVQDRVRAQLAALNGVQAGLTDVSFVSDGALVFRDNVDEAQRHGVTHIAEPGGTLRNDEVEQACAAHGIRLVQTGRRLFHH
jgi:phosphoribosylaminoimidazolecarboxamide formyltransferase/IMP cyclohydrolase